MAKSLDDDHQFGYTTELESKKKKKKSTQTHTNLDTHMQQCGDKLPKNKLATRELWSNLVAHEDSGEPIVEGHCG